MKQTLVILVAALVMGACSKKPATLSGGESTSSEEPRTSAKPTAAQTPGQEQPPAPDPATANRISNSNDGSSTTASGGNAPTPAVNSNDERTANHKANAAGIAAKLGVTDAPASLPDTGTGYTWKEALSLALAYAQSEPRTYNERHFLGGRPFESLDQAANAKAAYRNWHIELVAAYGLMQMGNSPIWPKQHKQAVSSVFMDERKRSDAFRWAMPAVRAAFRAMPSSDQFEYAALIAHVGEYASTVDVKREDEYLRSLQGTGCRSDEWQKKYYRLPKRFAEDKSGYFPCQDLFTRYGADGKATPYRKTQTFIYRRIKEGWPREAIKDTADKVLAELRKQS